MTSPKLKSPHNRDTSERDAKIVRLWRDRASNGLAKSDLQRRFGINNATLNRILKGADN